MHVASSGLYVSFKHSSLASSSTTGKCFTFAGLTFSSLNALVQFTGVVCIFYLALGNT